MKLLLFLLVIDTYAMLCVSGKVLHRPVETAAISRHSELHATGADE
jgi:hypothetical protein